MNEAIIDVPPEEMKGSGFPVVGNTPMTPQRLPATLAMCSTR